MFFSFNLIVAPIFAVSDGESDYRQNLQKFAENANIQQVDQPTSVIVNIINFVLSFIGLIFLIITMVAGFKYMTAGGKEEQVKSAKQSIQNGAIGVAIILFAAVFVHFVLRNLFHLF